MLTSCVQAAVLHQVAKVFFREETIFDANDARAANLQHYINYDETNRKKHKQKGKYKCLGIFGYVREDYNEKMKKLHALFWKNEDNAYFPYSADYQNTQAIKDNGLYSAYDRHNKRMAKNTARGASSAVE